jgi:hypothetical protein
MTPSEPNFSSCPGCGACIRVESQLPYGGYYHVSDACWALYTEVLGREFSNALVFGQVHQLTVDAYAVQHAGGRHPDKSVDVHLVGLHLVLDRERPPKDVPLLLQRLVSNVEDWPRFETPKLRGSATIEDVAAATTPLEHVEAARRWAEGVWRAWTPHHAAIATFCEDRLSSPE